MTDETEPRVLRLMAADAPFAEAVKVAIGSVRDFAQRNAVSETAVSGLINGSSAFPYEREREALQRELGVSREWLDLQLDIQRKRAQDGR